MNHEETARTNHKSGCNCGQAVFTTFARELGLTREEAMGIAPRPRSEGGQCGAYLAGKALLERLKPEAVSDFEAQFRALNGSTECRRLRGAGKTCNDYVGDAARLAEALLNVPSSRRSEGQE
jgi:hypothetical protein